MTSKVVSAAKPLSSDRTGIARQAFISTGIGLMTSVAVLQIATTMSDKSMAAP